MIITDPAAAVTRYINAVRDGDSSAIRECFAEDAIWDYPGDLPLSGTWRGRDSIVDDFLGTVGPALEPGSTVGWKSPTSSPSATRSSPSGPPAPPPGAAPLTTTATSASSPSATARSPPSASTPTPSTPRTSCSAAPDTSSPRPAPRSAPPDGLFATPRRLVRHARRLFATPRRLVRQPGRLLRTSSTQPPDQAVRPRGLESTRVTAEVAGHSTAHSIPIDREGFGTASRTKSFTIIENPSEKPRLS